MSSRRYLPLEEYGLVGDGRSAALVGRDGSVDWWCPPRFDAPSVFARLLDDRIGGFCSLAPAGAVHGSPLWESSQRYRPRTNVLVTEFRGADARLAVADAMPWPGPRDGGDDEGPGGRTRERGEHAAPTLIRRVEARGGPVEAELRFAPRFDYARRRPEFGETVTGWVPAAGGDGELLSLAVDRSPELEVDGRRDELTARFRVEPGEPRWITLRWGGGPGEEPEPVSAEAVRGALEATAERWRRRAAEVPVLAGPGNEDGDGTAGAEGSGRDSFAERARESVVRSALVLDLLTHAPTGAVIEAPTTSLPGAGPLRDGRRLPRSPADATAVLAGLLGLGRRREARRLCRRLAESGPGGRLRGDARTEPEGEPGEARALDHLHGHRGERPVRTGAAAAADAADDGAGGGRPNDAEHGTDAGGPGDPPAPGEGRTRSLVRAFGEARDLALAGRREEATEIFEAAAGRAGPTGLLSAAFDPDSGRLRGNVPSAAAHAALVEAARAIVSARGGAGPSGGGQNDQ